MTMKKFATIPGTYNLVLRNDDNQEIQFFVE